MLLLVGCSYLESISTDDEDEILELVDTENEITPHFDEIEGLLTRVELETGLGNLLEASTLFRELMTITTGHEVTVHQQARIYTMAELLADTLADEEILDEERFFSGSDAAAKVMNMIGFTPEGYVFVYHEIPSLFGVDGMGYYVFLVPANHEERDEMEIRETFFVTDRGEILVLD